MLVNEQKGLVLNKESAWSSARKVIPDEFSNVVLLRFRLVGRE
jgi:hypothetical protein